MVFRSFVILLGMAFGHVSVAEITGHASCIDLIDEVGCELKWSFPRSKNRNQSYLAQAWNPDSGAWEDLDSKKVFSRKGQRLGGVPAGHIYRILACTKAEEECVSSNAVWAPVWNRPEDIPDTVRVDGPQGPITFQVSRIGHNGVPHTDSEIITQYNMYLVHREALSFFDSDADMPRMLMPKMKGEAPDTIEEMVAYNVQQDYELIRSDVMTKRKSER